MADIEKYITELGSMSAEYQELNKRISRFGKWETDQLVGTFKALFKRFCPFKVGDRVSLSRSFTTDDKSHGWHHCQHYLTKGSTCVVKSRGFDHKAELFTFYVEFDNESRIGTGELMHSTPSKERHVFSFNEQWLKVIEDHSGIHTYDDM